MRLLKKSMLLIVILITACASEQNKTTTKYLVFSSEKFQEDRLKVYKHFHISENKILT